MQYSKSWFVRLIPLINRWPASVRPFSSSIAAAAWTDDEGPRRKNPRSISHYVFVRSVAGILRKTTNWESAVDSLCAAASKELTPATAAQVVRAIRNPTLALEFFEWLKRSAHGEKARDGAVFSAVLEVLARVPRTTPSQAVAAETVLQAKISLGTGPSAADFDRALLVCARAKRWEPALVLLQDMRARSFSPSAASCSALLGVLLRCKQLDIGWKLLDEILEGNLCVLDAATVNIAMKDLCKQGNLERAHQLLTTMTQKGCTPDLNTFNNLIKGCSVKGDVELLCSVFKRMLEMKVKPDSYTVNLLIKELCKQGRPERGNELFNYMRRLGWVDRKFVYFQLVDSLCSYGWWLKALKIFIKMIRRGHHPTSDLYVNQTRRLCLGGRFSQAFRLKDLLFSKRCLPGIDCYNGLLDGLSLAGRMDLVDKLLLELNQMGLAPDRQTHYAVLRGHCLAKNMTEALEWLEKIRINSWPPDEESCTSLITGLLMDGRVSEALHVKNSFQADCLINCSVYAAFITELMKNGEVTIAEDLLKEVMAREIHPNDRAVFDAAIRGYCNFKGDSESCNMLREMICTRCREDPQTYRPLVESLCKAGRVSDVLKLWEEMVESGHLPEVSRSVVCSLCEDGHLDAAGMIISLMFDSNLEHDTEIFRVYLCKLFHKDSSNLGEFLQHIIGEN